MAKRVDALIEARDLDHLGELMRARLLAVDEESRRLAQRIVEARTALIEDRGKRGEPLKPSARRVLLQRLERDVMRCTILNLEGADLAKDALVREQNERVSNALRATAG